MAVIPAPRRLKQEDCSKFQVTLLQTFKVSLEYHRNPVSTTTTTKQKTKTNKTSVVAQVCNARAGEADRWGDCYKFEISLVYIACSRPARAI